MWWYLESNFTRESALKNPFGEGLDGEGTGGLPIKVPTFEGLTEAQADEENMDTAEEIQYGEEKRVERKRECLLHGTHSDAINTDHSHFGRDSGGRGTSSPSDKTL